MKTNIIKANTNKAGSSGIIELLNKNNKPDTLHYIVVPDRYTLSVEQEICEKNESNGFYNVDVVSFTRLAIKLLNKKVDKVLSKEGTVILLNKIIRENNDKLLYYKDVKSYSFSKEMFAAIASLRDSNILVENINENLENLEGATKEKLHDIAICYDEYLKAINNKYIDTISRIDNLIKEIPNIDNIKNIDFYFFGFNIYSAKQMSLIKTLIKYGKSVNIAFAYDKWATNHNIYIVHQMEEFIDYCKNNNIEIKEIERTEILPANFQLLHQNMFGYVNQKLPFTNKVNDGKLVLYVEKNPYEEIKSIAKEINYLVKNKNLRYKEIALVIPDDNYKRVIEEIFSRIGIPFFVDTKYLMKNSIAVKYINSFLRALDSKYTKFDMLKLAHHPFWNFTHKEISCFESYVDKFDVNHTYFKKRFSFENSEIPESVRKRLINKLEQFKNKNNKIEYFCDMVIKLLDDENILNQLENYLNSNDPALIYSGDISDFIKVIEEIKAINGSQTVSLGEFISIINSAIANMGKGILPRSLDSVFVGSTKESRYSNIKALFIVGASSGQFPISSGDNVIFSVYDNEYMKRNGLKVYPTPIDNNNMERMVIVDLIAKPRNYLYIGYPNYDVNGEKLLSGEGLNEIMNITDINNLKKIIEYHNFDDNKYLEYILVNKKNAFFEYKSKSLPEKYKRVVEEFLIKNNMYKPPKMKLEKQEDYKELLFVKKEGAYQTSVSQIERYFSCPYSYFCQYGLGLNNKEDGQLQVYDIGSMIHNILEVYFRKYSKDLKKASEDELSDYINKSVNSVITDDVYKRFGRTGYGYFVLNNIKKESVRCLYALTDNLKNSSFLPTYFEENFGFGKDKKNLIIESNGQKFNFRGKIDRIDAYKDKILIIDYKTGKAEGKLEEIFTGEKIQLYLYLKAFMDEGKTPAGVCYLPIKNNYSKKNSKYAMKGQILDDYDTWVELDNNIENMDKMFQSSIVDFTFKRTAKGVDLQTGRKNKLLRNDFDTITKYVETIVSKALQEIMDGYFEKKPYEGKCKYCTYKNMCGIVKERKKISTKKIEDFKGKTNKDE